MKQKMDDVPKDTWRWPPFEPTPPLSPPPITPHPWEQPLITPLRVRPPNSVQYPLGLQVGGYLLSQGGLEHDGGVKYQSHSWS